MLLVVEAVRWVRREVKRRRTSNGSAMVADVCACVVDHDIYVGKGFVWCVL